MSDSEPDTQTEIVTDESAGIDITSDNAELPDTNSQIDTVELDQKELRRSARERKLALKAKENRVVVLSQSLMKVIEEQCSKNEKFLIDVYDLTDVQVESFLAAIESCTHSVSETFDEIKQLSENKLDPTTMSLVDQYFADITLVHEACDKRREEDDELLEVERKAEEAKRELERQMQEMEIRMAARRERMKQRLNRTSAPPTQNVEIVPAAIHTRADDSQSPATGHSQSTQQTPNAPAIELHGFQQVQTLQESQPGIKTNNSPASVNPSQKSYATPRQEFRTDWREPQASNIAREVTEHMHISLLAPPEPAIFRGDPLEYADWKVSFDSLIDSKRGTPIEKLHRLKKYVDGNAKEAISGYFRLQTTDAYQEALQTLHDEFGREDMIENSFRDKLEEWPKMNNKDQDALKKYSYFLRQCLAAQRAIPKLQVLNDKRENKKFIKALPGWLANRWIYFVAEQEERGGFPPFSKYVDFIAREARVSTHNLREMEDTKSSAKTMAKKEKPVRNLQTKASTQKNCLYCQKGPHPVTECRSLAAKSEQERDSFVRENKLCYGCLKPGHNSKECTNRATCAKCSKPHPTALHRQQKAAAETSNKPEQDKPQTKEPEKPKSERKNVNAVKHASSTGLLNMILPVYVSSGSKEQLVYALLDTQSDASFITTSLANQLTPPHTSERITMVTLHGENVQRLNRYAIKIRGYGLSNVKELEVQAYEQSSIPCNREQIPNSTHISDMPHLQHILKEFPPQMDIPIGILLGVDCATAMAPQEVVLGDSGEAFAIRTILGWTLCGERPIDNRTKTVRFTMLESDDSCNKKMSQNDMRFLEILETGTRQLQDGSWCLPLPFKDEAYLPNNKPQAERRLEQLITKLGRDDKFRQEYNQFMRDMIDNGHAELAPSIKSDSRTWYIPHFGIYHPKKNKLRIVFDASAKYKGHSLNDRLLTGPDHINNLVGILLRFRKNYIAISCDVEKMFHNFHVPEDHRLLRFLWIEQDTNTKEYRMTRHLFGATSSPGVATFALRSIAKQHEEEKPIASKFIVSDFYVDDGITSVDTVKEATSLIEDATEICDGANLRLHKFMSNSREALSTVPSSEIVKEMQGLDLFSNRLPTERTLGLEWSAETDTIEFKNNMKATPPSRRGILSAVSQLYDPLGLLAPFTLKGKIISQKACQETGEWDAEVSPPLKQEWKEWVDDLHNLKLIRIDRCTKPKNFGSVTHTELHHFSDASLQGFGACSYLRIIDEHDAVHVVLLMAKGRVVPTKPTTIPRLELQAAVEAVRLSATLKTELDAKINQEYFWSDSSIAIGYIRNSEHRYHMFVANRVREIRHHSDVTQWHHIPGKLNPADIVSRGADLLNLESSMWWHGPEYLHRLNITDYLNRECPVQVSLEDPEIKRTKTALCSKADTEDGKAAIDFKRYSSWTKLIKAVATAKSMLRNKNWKKPTIECAELQEAEKVILQLAQATHYPKEVKALKAAQQVNKHSSIISLTPEMDEAGLIRVGGRARKSLALGYEEKHPVIIPKTSPIAGLLIQYVHQKVHHQGQGTTLGALRELGYWVTGANKLVKSNILKCIKCQSLRGKPMQQLMGELPQHRVEPSPPFTHVGVDCFGPYTVKERRTEVKRWGLLFTCMYCRAVHIEVLDAMTAEAFITALRTFICIRGAVQTIYCDNGTNFVGAKNELHKELTAMSEEQQNKLKQQMIEFKFNSPGASHAGGVWERQIRTIKSVLNGMWEKYNTRMDTSGLRAAFYEAMSIVNSRPLCVDNVNQSTEVVVTPNHLVTMKPRQVVSLPGDFDDQAVYGRKMWRKVQQYADEFWREWKDKYLMDIIKRQKWQMKQTSLQKGDIVMIMDADQPRSQWPTAIVEETLKSDDGIIRKAKVRVANKHLDKDGKEMVKPTILERPIQKLVLLLPEREM